MSYSDDHNDKIQTREHEASTDPVSKTYAEYLSGFSELYMYPT